MPDLRNTQKQISTALMAMGVLSAVSAGLLLSPLVGSASSRQATISQLSTDLVVKKHQVEPLRGIDKKVINARGEIKDFFDERFPSVESSVSEALGKVASEHNVKIDTAKYDDSVDERDDRNSKNGSKEAQAVGLRRVLIEAAFSGNYPDMMRFVNGLEKSKTFFLVDNINVGESQGGEVKLQMKLEAFVRANAS